MNHNQPESDVETKENPSQAPATDQALHRLTAMLLSEVAVNSPDYANLYGEVRKGFEDNFIEEVTKTEPPTRPAMR